VAAVEAVEDNFLAKAAGNVSIDGRMTACDDKIGRRTTTQQPTNKRRHDGGGSGGVGSAMPAAAWRRRGGGAQRDGGRRWMGRGQGRSTA
jgi:hypothetical protein